MRTSRAARPRSSARSRTRAVLAAPSTAGAATRTRRTPSTTPSTRVAAARGDSRTANRTAAEVKTSERAPQGAEHDQDEEPGPVHHPGRWQQAADRGKDRLGRLDQERGYLVPPGWIDPGHDD